MITTPALSADTLRFVRTCTDLSRAIAQHKAAERKVTVWAAGAASGNEMSEKMLPSALENAAAWFLRVAELHDAANPAPIEAPRAPNVVDIAAEAAIEAMRERGRQKRAAEKAKSQPEPQAARSDADVCRVKAWRKFMAIAKSLGMDCQARERMTVALATFLGCIIPSRSILSAGQICEAAAALELGLLAW